MQDELRALGLTWNETKVYLSLVKLGESPVSQVIKDLKVHRQIVYNALEELENKKLIFRSIKKKIFYFKVNDPEILVENAKKQEILAERVSKKIEKSLKHNRREDEINIYNGSEGIRRAHLKNYKNMPIGACHYVLASSAKRHVEILGERFFSEEYEKVRRQRKLFSKNIFSEDFRGEIEELMGKKIVTSKIRQSRYLPYDSSPLFTTVIWGDRITMMSMGEDLFMIEIINQQLRDSYKEQFDLLWEIAKE